MVPSVKESVKFKLNTECPGRLSLLFFSRTQQHYGLVFTLRHRRHAGGR